MFGTGLMALVNAIHYESKKNCKLGWGMDMAISIINVAHSLLHT
jgi:hypothetical protein